MVHTSLNQYIDKEDYRTKKVRSYNSHHIYSSNGSYYSILLSILIKIFVENLAQIGEMLPFLKPSYIKGLLSAFWRPQQRTVLQIAIRQASMIRLVVLGVLSSSLQCLESPPLYLGHHVCSGPLPCPLPQIDTYMSCSSQQFARAGLCPCDDLLIVICCTTVVVMYCVPSSHLLFQLF